MKLSRTTAGRELGAISSDNDRPLPKDRRRQTAAAADTVSAIPETGGSALGVTTTGTMREDAVGACRSLLFQRVKDFRSSPRARH